MYVDEMVQSARWHCCCVFRRSCFKHRPVTVWYSIILWNLVLCRLQLKCDGTRWRTGGEVKRKWRMQWVASTLHTTSEHGVSSITTADAHTSAASSRLNWHPPADLNGLVRFARETKSGFCACAIIFQLASTTECIYWRRQNPARRTPALRSAEPLTVTFDC